MCGPADDEKQKAVLEKFLDDCDSAFDETLRKQSGILSPSASSPIFDGNEQSISVSDSPRSRRTGKRGSKNQQWVN